MAKTSKERRRKWLQDPKNREKDRRESRERYRAKRQWKQTKLPLQPS